MDQDVIDPIHLATFDDQNRLKMLEVGYTQMRKSEFFNKRLKKDTSNSRLNTEENK